MFSTPDKNDKSNGKPNNVFKLKEMQEMIQSIGWQINIEIKNSFLITNCILIYMVKISLDIVRNFSTASNNIGLGKVPTRYEFFSSSHLSSYTENCL